MSLNGGYAMIKYNSTQEELQIAYRSKKPTLFYDENQRAHWAVIEETATQSVDEETQEPITLYEYSYRLLDEASGGGSTVIANPTLNGDEATLDGIEVDGTKYKVGGSGGSGGKLYLHKLIITKNDLIGITNNIIGTNLNLLYSIVTSSNEPITFDTFMNITHFDNFGLYYGTNVTGGITISGTVRAIISFSSYNTNNRAEIGFINDVAVLEYTNCKFESVDRILDTVTEV